MKAIYALSSALLLVFGLQGSVGSAQTLASTFDVGDEGWGLAGGAAPSWQRFGGRSGWVFPGGGDECRSLEL